MELTAKSTTQFLERALSFSVTALNTTLVYHQMSGSSLNIWTRGDRKSDTSICQEGMKCFSDSFIYVCWKSSFVRIFTEYLKWTWQEKRHLILSRGPEVFQWQIYIRLLNIIICQDLHRIFEMEMTGRATPHLVKRAWSVSVTALFTSVEQHHLSGSPPNFWNGDDRKSDASVCQEGMKCFSNSFIYDCCISSIVRSFIVFLKWSWQEKRRLNLSKWHEVFQWQLCIRLFYNISCQDLHRLFEMEMTGKATPQFVKSSWSVSVTALYTIVEYHHLSGSSPKIWNGDDRKSDTSICQEGMKRFSNSFIYDCCISSIVRIFMEYLKWRWQEKRQPKFVKSTWSVSVTALYTIVVYHQLSGSSSVIWNGDERKSDTSVRQKLMKCFSDSFIYDCWISSFVRIFTENLKWRWQENRHLNVSRGHEVFQ